MTVRIYAALTIALACGVGGCSTNPGVPGTQASSSVSPDSSSEGNAKLSLGKGNGEGSADVTGSIPPKEVSKSGNAPAAVARMRASGAQPQQQSRAEETRLPEVPKTAARKLDEPLYRPPATQTSQAQQPSASVTPGSTASGDPTNAMALASAGTAPTRNVVVASVQPTPSQSESISLSYPTDAVELSEKDRRSLIGFVSRRGPADRITVVTGPSSGANPLEGLLRVQERGRRLGELLATRGPVEVKFEPDLPRDSVRID